MATRNYVESYNALRGDSDLSAQCEMYILTGAVPAIYAEDPGTQGHAARVEWADRMVTDAAALAKASAVLAIYAIGNATIRAAIASGEPAEDSDVEYVGSLYLDTLIGLTYA